MKRLLALLAVVVVSVLSGVAWAAPPQGRPDPRMMSGRPRVDEQIPGGTITVRVLRGSFDNPALAHPVKLEITASDGTKTTIDGETKNQGRATFSDLGAYAGGTAIASVELDGESLASAPMQIRGDVGTAVMLVSGGSTPSADAPQRPPGGTPMPGTVFEFDSSRMPNGVEAGQLMVGTFDLTRRAPLTGVTITLKIEEPGAEAREEQLTTDHDGKVVFQGLQGHAAGTKYTVVAPLDADRPAQQSEVFERIDGKGMAVVFATGDLPEAPPSPHTPARTRLPGPRSVPSLPDGAVRVRVVDGGDRPVADQPVTVILEDASQTQVKFQGKTDATGVAIVPNVDVRSDAFYFVAVVYDSGPYRSGFFQLDRKGGVAVDLRVYETTSDRSLVQSALQYEVRGGENDVAQVYRIYEVVTRGDKAFWDPDFKIEAAEGGKSVTVLRPAEPWLSHDTKAPYATLSRPLPPGEPIHLSLAWVAEHSGSISVDWNPPFELLQAGVIVDKDYELHADGAKKSDRSPPDEQVELWELGTARPVKFAVTGLPIRNPAFRLIGEIAAFFLVLTALVMIAKSPRRTPAERLRAKRDMLVALLRKEERTSPRYRRIIDALDHVYRQLDAIGDTESRPATATPPAVVGLAAVLGLIAIAGVVEEFAHGNAVLLHLSGDYLAPRSAGAIFGIWTRIGVCAATSVLLFRLDRRAVYVLFAYVVVLSIALLIALFGSVANLAVLPVLGVLAVAGALFYYTDRLRKKGTLY